MASRYYADNVGSFLRPAYLKEALDRNAPADELSQLQDQAVRDVVRLQEEVGLPVVTDGEFRRRIWYHTILAVADGFDPERFDRAWTDEQGRVHHHGAPVVVSPLRRKARQVDVELDFLARSTSLPIKVTIPSPTHFLSYWTEGVSDLAYESRRDFLDDLIGLINEDAKALADAGASYLQLDAPKYTFLTDERLFPDQNRVAEQLAEHVRDDLRVLEGVSGVTTGIHICRGNYRSMFYASGGYDRIAERVFRRSRFQRFLLEYDDARSGTFEPLRYVPDDRTVVLGLVSTKKPRLESMADLESRIAEAARVVPIERLALSPQCGFASTSEGNRLSFEEQRRKLELVAEAARAVWSARASPAV
jgi:5-methyltetrahydropteroyltriglutamate--homocysteine methyltransferase